MNDSKCGKCGSELVWQGSVMSGSLVCEVCGLTELLNDVVCSGAVADEDIFVGQKNDWAAEVDGDWTEQAAANIKRLNEEQKNNRKARAGIQPQYDVNVDSAPNPPGAPNMDPVQQVDPDDDSGC